jgi:hypothetical protein
MSSLTEKDYREILEYYKKPIPRSKRILKENAEKIMSSKLCKCIKKIDSENEAKSIGICTKTIFNTKGITRGKFQCKKKQSVTMKKISKNNNKKLMKSKKNKKGGQNTNEWDIEKGSKNDMINSSYIKRIPPDYIKQQEKDMKRALSPISQEKMEEYFAQGPPELREQKGMMIEDIESYANEIDKPMEKFGKGGKKINTYKSKKNNQKI